MLKQENCTIGAGVIPKMLKALAENNVQNATEKVALLITGKFYDTQVVMDKFKVEKPHQFKVKSNKCHVLFVQLVKKTQNLTTD
jgi:hypothetical protein